MQGRVIDPPEMFVHHGRQDRCTREQGSVSLRRPAGLRKDSGCFYPGGEPWVPPPCPCKSLLYSNLQAFKNRDIFGRWI